jgi:hypothetical protein
LTHFSFWLSNFCFTNFLVSSKFFFTFPAYINLRPRSWARIKPSCLIKIFILVAVSPAMLLNVSYICYFTSSQYSSNFFYRVAENNLISYLYWFFLMIYFVKSYCPYYKISKYVSSCPISYSIWSSV